MAGDPADGDYDFVFRLFDDPEAGAQIGADVPIDDWPVRNGLFTVQLDFGSGVFTGHALWLEVAVRPGDSGGDYTLLSPRKSHARFELRPFPTRCSSGTLTRRPVPSAISLRVARRFLVIHLGDAAHVSSSEPCVTTRGYPSAE